MPAQLDCGVHWGSDGAIEPPHARTRVSSLRRPRARPDAASEIRRHALRTEPASQITNVVRGGGAGRSSTVTSRPSPLPMRT